MGRKCSPCARVAFIALVLSSLLPTSGAAFGFGREDRQLPKEALRDLGALSQRHAAVIASMPNHPMSGKVFGEAVALVRDTLSIDAHGAWEVLVREFPDNPLGLMALRRVLGDGSEAIAFCEDLCGEIPDSRAAAMAFDHLVRHGEGGLPRCEEAMTKAPDTRLARFARIRRGDLLAERGEWRAAIRFYLEALVVGGDYAARVPGKLAVAFEGLGEPAFTTLARAFPAGEAYMVPLWKRVQAAMEGKPSEERTLANTVHAALAARSYGSAHEALAELAERFASASELSPSQIDLGLAQFLWVAEPPADVSWEQARAFLTHRNALEELSEAIVARCRGGMWQLTPAEEAAYTGRIAARQLDRLDIEDALDSFIRLAEMGRAPEPLRIDGVLSAARLHDEELHDLDAAAEACASFCRAWPEGPAPVAVRLAATEYAFRAGDHRKAREQASRLIAEHPASVEASRARMVRATCFLHQGQIEPALTDLRSVAERRPGSVEASRALLLAGKTHMSRMEHEAAREAFQELLKHDAISPEAEKARRYLGALGKRTEE